jgi:hypothetical protein
MTETKVPKAPEGYKDEAEFLDEARKRFQDAVDSDRENRDEGLEDARFAAGEQWDEDAKKAREGLPCLVINQLPQFIAQVVGDIRINRPAIRVRPAEDADQELAEVREGLIRAIERDCDAQGVYASAGQAQVTSGIGNFRVKLDYADEMSFERDIRIERIPDPFAVAWDPLSIEPTGKDARYCFVTEDMPRAQFEKAYPNATPSDLAVHQEDVEGWLSQDTVKVAEYWRVIDKPVEIVRLGTGEVVRADEAPEGAVITDRRQSSQRYACLYLITGNAVLDGPYELPISRVPIFRVQGWEINVGQKRVRFGLVRWAKDPQRLKNYWRSVAAQTIALAPKGKWLASTSAVPEDREDDFRMSAKSADPLLLYEPSGQMPIYTPPPAVPTALLQEAAQNSQDMKDVTGLHDASLGIRSNETSGRAIMARQREGDVATYVYHDNLRAAIAEAGKVVNQLIPIVYDTPRTVRIVGEDEATKVLRVNDPSNPQSVDINRGRYDVAVEAGPSYSTRRVEAAESMMQFVQAVPGAAQVASDLIARAMDWPMADTIAERLKKTLPPQLLEGEDGEEPRQPSPQEMQAMELQQQVAQAEVIEKMASARKAEADADKARYEADKAELELVAMQGYAAEGDRTFGEADKMQAALRPVPQPQPVNEMPPMEFDPEAMQGLLGQGLPTPEQPATGMTGI